MRYLARALGLIVIVAGAIAALTSIVDGFDVRILGVRLASHGLSRPLIVAIGALVGRCALLRTSPLREIDRFAPLNALAVATLLAVVLFITGVWGNSGIAGGADSSGYLSEAELWLKGSLVVPNAVAKIVPWPNGSGTMTPLGYSSSASGESLVPTYPPGFPLLLALGKRVMGVAAARIVVPLCGAMFVVAVFFVGREIASPHVGAWAAWMAASSAPVLYMIMNPMSDVPAAAFWTAAVAGVVRGSIGGVVLAGVCAGVAALIRPNVAFLAGIVFFWLAATRQRQLPVSRAVLGLVGFVIPVTAAFIGIGLFNNRLYGSWTATGYGSLDVLFSWSHVKDNALRYSGWVRESATWLMLVVLVTMFVPQRWLGMQTKTRGRALLALMTAGVIGCYLLYLVFDAWWFLRFWLPCWGLVCVSAAWLASWPTGRRAHVVGRLVMVGVGLYGMLFARANYAFDLVEAERRYATVAALVRDTTEPNSVIYASQHSGSVRYYSERVPVRWDLLDEGWLDRSVQWFADRGAHPYFLLEDWEVPLFKARFAAANRAGQLKLAEVWRYDSGNVHLFDATQPDERGTPRRVIPVDAAPRLPWAVPPGREPRLVVKS